MYCHLHLTLFSSLRSDSAISCNHLYTYLILFCNLLLFVHRHVPFVLADWRSYKCTCIAETFGFFICSFDVWCIYCWDVQRDLVHEFGTCYTCTSYTSACITLTGSTWRDRNSARSCNTWVEGVMHMLAAR